MFKLYIKKPGSNEFKLLAFPEYLSACLIPEGQFSMYNNDLQHQEWEEDCDRCVLVAGWGWEWKQSWRSSGLSFHVLNHLKYFIQYIIIDNVGGKFNKMAPILEFLIISTGSRTCIWTRDGTLSFHSLWWTCLGRWEADEKN